jgi:adenylate cyclase
MKFERHQIRRAAHYTAIAALAALAAILLGNAGAFHSFEMRALDAQFVLRGKSKPAPEVVLLAIDQKSYDNIPDVQLFWHPLYAEAIRAAADGGAKVMGVDITFTVPVQKWEPDHDRMLAEAAATTAERMPIVIGYVPSVLTRQGEWPVPINMMMSALRLAAFVNLTADEDSFIRRQELFEQPEPAANPEFARSLALRVVEKYRGEDAVFEGGTLTLAGSQIPVSADRAIPISYAGPAGTYPSVSLWDFLQAARAGNHEQLRKWVGNKIVLMGVDALTDRHPTPFYTPFSGNRWTTAGVEIHANTVGTVLSGNYLQPIASSLRTAGIVAVAIAAVCGTVLPGNAAATVVIATLLGLILSASHLLFRNGLVVSVPELLVTFATCVVATGVYRLSTSQKRTELFGRALRAFVGRDMASTLDISGGIELSGHHEFVTILFSDIRGFTAFCEEKDPAVVVEVLNRYMAEMVRVITSHGGLVNKFIGDGILAVFADKDPGAEPGDHPSRAVQCGIKMCTVETGFDTGVGINTGLVVIGTVGSADRVEYTVLGDAVNVASRIESLNKDQHTKLLMSQSTHDLLDEQIETMLLGSVHIRGQSRTMNIYTAKVLEPERAVNAART